MRYDKNTPRRVGGLLLDAIMLVFVFTFTFSDPKGVDKNSKENVTIIASDGNGIVFGIDAIQSSLYKFLSKIHPSQLKSADDHVDLTGVDNTSNLAFASNPALYNIFSSDANINAP